MTEAEPRLVAPATARNRAPILAVLRRILPQNGLVLEIASGSGEHALHFATALPELTFQPSDPDPRARDSIDAWASGSALPNLRPALQLDAASRDWPVERPDAILCINMVHISPWAATQGLMREGGRLLSRGAPLYLYGPYRRTGIALAPSNAAFDESLRSRDPAWGLRELDAVAELAQDAGFGAPEVIEMPANNLSVVFQRL